MDSPRQTVCSPRNRCLPVCQPPGDRSRRDCHRGTRRRIRPHHAQLIRRGPGGILLHRPALADVSENREPDKCKGLRWFPLGALPEHMIDYCRTALGNVAANRAFSLYGW
jgi:hypothetical protein